jgi:hypothetical protein
MLKRSTRAVVEARRVEKQDRKRGGQSQANNERGLLETFCSRNGVSEVENSGEQKTIISSRKQ